MTSNVRMLHAQEPAELEPRCLFPANQKETATIVKDPPQDMPRRRTYTTDGQSLCNSHR